MPVLTPEQFKERNPHATPAAVAAYTIFYETVGRGYLETKESAARFENNGGWGGWV